MQAVGGDDSAPIKDNYLPKAIQHAHDLSTGAGGVGGEETVADTAGAGQGLRLQAGSPAAHWLQRHGLRPGDALLSLDGQPLHGLSPQQLAGRLQGRASASLLWQRDGQTHTTVLRMP